MAKSGINLKPYIICLSPNLTRPNLIKKSETIPSSTPAKDPIVNRTARRPKLRWAQTQNVQDQRMDPTNEPNANGLTWPEVIWPACSQPLCTNRKANYMGIKYLIKHTRLAMDWRRCISALSEPVDFFSLRKTMGDNKWLATTSPGTFDNSAFPNKHIILNNQSTNTACFWNFTKKILTAP